MTQSVSTKLANRDAQVIVLNPVSLMHSNVFIVEDSIAAPILSLNDTVALAEIPVDAVIHELDLTFADLGTTGVVDVGLYLRTGTPGNKTYTAVSVNAIASGLDVTQPNQLAIAPQRLNGLSADATGKKAWEVAGLTQKPDYALFFIGIKATTATTATGTIALRAILSVNP